MNWKRFFGPDRQRKGGGDEYMTELSYLLGEGGRRNVAERQAKATSQVTSADATSTIMYDLLPEQGHIQ